MTETAKPQPLAGVRVLELGAIVAAPFCTRLLGDFGAEVVKVEPTEGDALRTFGKHYEGKSLYASSIFRNKQMTSVDLRTEKGREIVLQMIPHFDVLVENFRPGVMEGWGFGYDDLAALNPGLVMVRISGFGQTGPYRRRPGFGVIGEAVGALRHMIGDPDRPPARVAVALTDMITGMYAAYGAVIALLGRATTGRGQCVDANLYESAFSFMEPHIPAYEKFGLIPTRRGSGLANSAPNNLYPTKDGGYVHIMAGSMRVWKRCTAAIGREDLLEDPRFADILSVQKNSDEVDGIIAEWTSERTLEEIEAALKEADVPAARIYTMADAFNDPHYAAREAIIEIPDDDIGSVKVVNVVPRLSGTPGVIRKAGGQNGADTRVVLSEMLGFDDATIDALAAEGVIHCADETAAQKPGE